MASAFPNTLKYLNPDDLFNPTPIEDVFKALASERRYQRGVWGYRQDDGTMAEAPHGVCDFVLYMEDYLHEARTNASRKDGNKDALDSLRKVVALGIACFEQHGIKPREFSPTKTNYRDHELVDWDLVP